MHKSVSLHLNYEYYFVFRLNFGGVVGPTYNAILSFNKTKREAIEAPAVGGGGRRTNQASRPLPFPALGLAPGDRQLMPQLQ